MQDGFVQAPRGAVDYLLGGCATGVPWAAASRHLSLSLTQTRSWRTLLSSISKVDVTIAV